MKQELINKEKRKREPLTTKEWLTFFIFPVNPNSRLNSKSANQIELERYKKFGFILKTKQAETARTLGIIFYLLIIFFIVFI